MIKVRIILFGLMCVLFSSCNNEENQFPLDKRYWDIQDYKNVRLELRHRSVNDVKLPTFENPETRIIVEKLTDEQNFNIVLDDNELGLKHKNDVAESFFNEWTNMGKIYNATDRKDQYVYEKEMLAVWHFGLGLQLKYFKLGNDQIIKRADDPNSEGVRQSVNSNINTLIGNYIIYLDEVNNEKAYTSEGKEMLALGIEKYFVELIKLYPEANYSRLIGKSELLVKKIESVEVKEALNKLIELAAKKNSEYTSKDNG